MIKLPFLKFMLGEKVFMRAFDLSEQNNCSFKYKKNKPICIKSANVKEIVDLTIKILVFLELI